LKLIPDAGLIRLLEIFESILNGKFFPKIWKKYSVILLQKPTKKDFRPISLASCLLKILERIVKRRIERYIKLDYLIPDSQYGFRKGKSCNNCLALLNLEIYKSFIMEDCVETIFLLLKLHMIMFIHLLFSIINNLKTPIWYKLFIKRLLDNRLIEIYELDKYQGTGMFYKNLPQG